MAAVDLKSLINKLDRVCQQALEAAAGMCLSRGNYNIEIEHWLLKIMDEDQSDLIIILKQLNLNPEDLKGDLWRSLEQLKAGNVRPPSFSQSVIDLCHEAWLLVSLDFNQSQIRSAHLMLALLQDENLARIAGGISKFFKEISVDKLREILPNLAESIESKEVGAHLAAPSNSQEPPTGQGSALAQFTLDLTQLAQQGRIDPVLGRDQEIRQIIDILTRRKQNNPILTGEAGVGKTAVVEGFALRIVNNEVPRTLLNTRVCSLDLGLLQAGAGVKGEFERRLKAVINEVKGSAQPIILFIDEAHTLIGAGNQAGQGDAANLLKPELARGELRTIAATTWSEYKKYFEQDPALTRRFQVIKVEEPDEKSAIGMVQGIIGTLEKHHKVRILNEAVVEAVRLSSRYLAGRQLPDKAISLLDTACAKVAIGHEATPSLIEDCQHNIGQLKTSQAILTKEADLGISAAIDALPQIESELTKLNENLEDLSEQWRTELGLIKEIQNIGEEIAELGEQQHKLEAVESEPKSVSEPDCSKISEADAGDAGYAQGEQACDDLEDLSAERIQLQKRLTEQMLQLTQVQGERPLLQVWVDGTTVAEVIGGWTGIPVGRMLRDEINSVLKLREILTQRIIGQDKALTDIAQTIQTSRAKMTDPRKPIGVFLLVGPSGVGKTETALALAEALYGGEQNLTVINMSEFKEEHKVSTLIGAPPGYVGYGQGGILTEAVRRKPYSLVLLDEMEKSHHGVQEIFYQVLDKGMLRDSEGRDIDFKNTVIIMTSNAGGEVVARFSAAISRGELDEAAFTDALHADLLKTFKPAFLGRVQIIPFFTLNDDVMQGIVKLQLQRVAQRIFDNYQAEFSYDSEVVSYITQRCNQTDAGARNVEYLLTRGLLPELSTKVLASLANNQLIKSIKVGVVDNQFNFDLEVVDR